MPYIYIYIVYIYETVKYFFLIPSLNSINIYIHNECRHAEHAPKKELVSKIVVLYEVKHAFIKLNRGFYSLQGTLYAQVSEMTRMLVNGVLKTRTNNTTRYVINEIAKELRIRPFVYDDYMRVKAIDYNNAHEGNFDESVLNGLNYGFNESCFAIVEGQRGSISITHFNRKEGNRIVKHIPLEVPYVLYEGGKYMRSNAGDRAHIAFAKEIMSDVYDTILRFHQMDFSKMPLIIPNPKSLFNSVGGNTKNQRNNMYALWKQLDNTRAEEKTQRLRNRNARELERQLERELER